MSQPFAIELEFGSGVFTWGGTASFVNLASKAFSFSVQRGRSDYTQPFQAGTCTVTFRNLDGELDPDNAAGPYFGKILPGRRLRIRAIPDDALGSTTIFAGFITDIELSYDVSGDATVTMTAVDGLSILAQQQIAEGTSFPEQSTGDRFNAVSQLPEVDYPFLQQRAAGFSICEAGNASGNVVSYLEKIATTEQGAIFVDRDGILRFVDRYQLLNPPTFTFRDVGSNPPSGFDFSIGQSFANYEGIQRLVTSTELHNRLQSNRVDEPAVIRESFTSINLFGIRFLELSEVLFRSDGEVADMLDFALVRFASTSPRIAEVTTLLDDKPLGVFRSLAGLDLLNSVTVEFTPPNVAQIVVPSLIESIRHDYTVGQGWRLTFGFTPRDTSNYLVLDDATLGQLDANVLGF
jgi:hypothetical protein